METIADGGNAQEARQGVRQYPEEIRQAARGMYLRRYTVADISDALGVPRRTVYHWSTTGEWDALLTHETAEEAVTRRLTLLAERDPKTPGELREVDLLVGTLERLQALRTKEVSLARHRGLGQDSTHPGPAHQPDAAPGEFAADSPSAAPRAARPRRGKPIKNDVTALTPQLFADKFHRKYFGYQHALRAAKQHRNRMLLKARQIGATWYFAQEAFEDACLTGDNQIFLSATKAQSQVFRNYIVQAAGAARRPRGLCPANGKPAGGLTTGGRNA